VDYKQYGVKFSYFWRNGDFEMNKLVTIAGWMITISMPFFLIMFAVRILLTPIFINAEYRIPDFPEDPYGFTMQDRLYWAQISLDYLQNNEGLGFFQQYHLSDGSSLYNDRELSHMSDVKILVQQMILAHNIIIGLYLVFSLFTWKSRQLKTLGKSLANGGWLTIGIIIAILVGIAISFNQLFTDFHRIFFTGDTWLFLFSDTLIRLFPIRFWSDAFTVMGILTLVGAGLSLWLGRSLEKSRK
jgi:integral membrane protein (TIGR01906 family)